MKISEIITDKYKLRMPPTVYYDLLSDVLEAEDEQEPKSEWEHDHEILKAYSDGASDVLDKIRAEIDKERFIDKCTRICKNANASGLEVAMQIIDKYKAESEDKE